MSRGFGRAGAAIALVLAIGAVFSAAPASAQQTAAAQKTFASPEEAVAALRAAAEAHDKAALQDLFGADIHELLNGDDARDRADSHRFAQFMNEGVATVAEGENRVVLEVGPDKWPFPVALVKEGPAWRFDTADGKEEILDRHIGKDELHAIGVCETYVREQKRRAGSGKGEYARKLRSASGQKDGLYWKPWALGAPSPLKKEVAQAEAAADGSTPKPFHGYFFKVLTRQGDGAPGGKTDYVKDGRLTGGFALEAYPEHWGKSGIMTFIVNQDGKIYRRDFGGKTSAVAAAMTEYDPDGGWTPETDPGVVEK